MDGRRRVEQADPGILAPSRADRCRSSPSPRGVLGGGRHPSTRASPAGSRRPGCWWLMFGVTEAFVLHVQAHRRETQAISLSEIPLVLALLYVAPVHPAVGASRRFRRRPRRLPTDSRVSSCSTTSRCQAAEVSLAVWRLPPDRATLTESWSRGRWGRPISRSPRGRQSLAGWAPCARCWDRPKGALSIRRYLARTDRLTRPVAIEAWPRSGSSPAYRSGRDRRILGSPSWPFSAAPAGRPTAPMDLLRRPSRVPRKALRLHALPTRHQHLTESQAPPATARRRPRALPRRVLGFPLHSPARGRPPPAGRVLHGRPGGDAARRRTRDAWPCTSPYFSSARPLLRTRSGRSPQPAERRGSAGLCRDAAP